MSNLLETIQQHKPELPVYSSGPINDKLDQVSDTLLGKNPAGKTLTTAINNLNDRVSVLLKTPLPGTTPSYAPAETAEQSNENGSSAPSFSRGNRAGSI